MKWIVFRLGTFAGYSRWLLERLPLMVGLFGGEPWIRVSSGKSWISGVRKSYSQAGLGSMLCLTALCMYVKQCAAHTAIRLMETSCCKQSSIGHPRIMHVNFPEEKYEPLEKSQASLIWRYSYQIWRYGMVGYSRIRDLSLKINVSIFQAEIFVILEVIWT